MSHEVKLNATEVFQFVFIHSSIPSFNKYVLSPFTCHTVSQILKIQKRNRNPYLENLSLGESKQRKSYKNNLYIVSTERPTLPGGVAQKRKLNRS